MFPYWAQVLVSIIGWGIIGLGVRWAAKLTRER